ncbi:MAG: WG repeat-containing protein [Bacteroidales bacterium]|nr:WG repeat-containing protein [Bacteroidales bacterium]
MKILAIFFLLTASFILHAQKTVFFEDNEKLGVKTTSGKIIIPANIDNTSDFYSGIAWIEKEGKYAFVSEKGGVIFSEWYDMVQLDWSSRDEFLQVWNNRKTALINKKGEVISEWCDSIGRIYESDFWFFRNNGKETVFNNEQKQLTPWVDRLEIYDDSEFLYYSILYNNNKVAFTANKFSRQSEWVDSIYDFYNYTQIGSMWVKIDKKYTLINEDLKIAEFRADKISDLYHLEENNYFFVENDGKTALVGRNHELLTDWFDIIINEDLYYFTFIRIKKDNKYAYLKPSSKKIEITEWYDFLFPTEDMDSYDYSIVEKNGKFAIINRDFKTTTKWYDILFNIESEYGVFVAGNANEPLKIIDMYDKKYEPVWENYFDKDRLVVVRSSKGYGIMNSKGETKIHWCLMRPYSFDRALAYNCDEKRRCTYLDIQGNPIGDYIFEDGLNFNQNKVAAVKLNGKWGIIDEKGDFLFNPSFRLLKSGWEDNFIAERDGYAGLIDSNGKTIVQFIYSKIDKYKKDYYLATKDGMKGVIDSKGNIIIPFIYDYIYYSSKNFASVKIGKEDFFEIDEKGNKIP